MYTVALPPLLDGEDKSSPFKNAIRNNYKHIKKWAKRTESDCFRIYDRDIGAYKLAIDFYNTYFSIQYFSPNKEEVEPPTALIEEVEETLFALFGTPKENLFWRFRKKRGKFEQYEKRNNEKSFFQVKEYGTLFYINLTDYLDTGLFLDHRETRQLVAKSCSGKRLLNLFAYTCSFSVQAAMHGAKSTLSLDLSNTYTEWGERNFLLNGLSLKNNRVVKADCMAFLRNAVRQSDRYDVIVIDPPTISRSKSMEGMFDVQQDYPFLLAAALRLLTEDGVIYFSTNLRSFTLDPKVLAGAHLEEITEKTIPFDFRRAKIHRCWKISKAK